MFIPSNFCITFGFTNVMWNTKIIPYIDNVRFIIPLSFIGNKDRIFQIFHVTAILKQLLVNLWNLEFTVVYVNAYERFCNFKQSRWNYKTFISKFFTLSKLINDTVNETQWVISHHKIFFHQGDFFVKVWLYSFWTMKITIDCILFIACWRLGGIWWR